MSKENSFILYLASASPRRKELLESLHLEFQIALSAAPELPHPAKINGIKDLAIVTTIAEAKAEGAWAKISRLEAKQGLILAADTLVFLGDRVFGKPKTEAGAREMLSLLSGETHTVATGISAYRFGDGELSGHESRMVTTSVKFREISPTEIEWYISTGEPMDKAGAYGAQGFGSIFLETITGSYTNVVGLPLMETMSLIDHVGGVPWQSFIGGV